MAHTELGFGVMKRAVTALATMGHPDADPKLIGRNIHVMLTPLPPNKRKPKFHVRSDEEEAANRAEHEDEQRGATDSGSNPPPAKA
jgi:translation initiation factor IF-3